MFRVALRLLLAAALGAAPALARADVYRWVDDQGTAHFATSREAIPRGYRDSATVIPEPPATVANPSSSRPPARPVAPEPPPAPAATTPGEATPPVDAPGPAEPAPAPAESSAPAEQPTLQSDAQKRPAAEPAPTGDPRVDEIAELEGQIERDRETLRQLISTPRWDSAELASDPRVREIAERLPRLQAELAALRSESEH